VDYVEVPAPQSAYVMQVSVSGEFIDKVIAAESSGNPLARPCDSKTGKPLSSAFGVGQFVEATWLEMVRKHRPDLAAKSDEELLDMRGDYDMSREMTVRYAEENRAQLLKAGLQPTDAAMYLAHFAGARGTTNLLKAHRDTAVEDILSAKALGANGFLEGKTVAMLYAWAKAKMAVTVPPASRRVAVVASDKVTPHAEIPGCGPAKPAADNDDRQSEAVTPRPKPSRTGQTVRLALNGVTRLTTKN
jgi:hypothetical protein